MGAKDAVATRFKQLCKERNIRNNGLVTLSGVTPSTVYSLLDPRRREVSITAIKKLCNGLDISLGEFFSTEVFDQLDQEIE